MRLALNEDLEEEEEGMMEDEELEENTAYKVCSYTHRDKADSHSF